jgi:hypothetical protein
MNTGAGWVKKTLVILWTDIFLLWKSRNEAVHGHDLTSQLQVRRRKLWLEIEILHSKRTHVLACNTDVFYGDTPAKVNHYLETANVSQMQKWLNIWKPFILHSIQEAEEFSRQGVSLLTNYFPNLSQFVGWSKTALP